MAGVSAWGRGMALPTARALVDDFLAEQHAAEEFTELFEAYDTDSSGSIESDEFLALARDFLPALLGEETWDTLCDAFARADASRTGWLDKGEFVSLCASVFPPRVLNQKGRLHLRTQLDLLRLFKTYDVDGSGFIELSEFERLMPDITGQTVPPHVLQGLFGKVDENADGRISFAEFCGGIFLASAEVTNAAAQQPPSQQQQEPQQQPHDRNGRIAVPVPVPVPFMDAPLMWAPPMMPPLGLAPFAPLFVQRAISEMAFARF